VIRHRRGFPHALAGLVGTQLPRGARNRRGAIVVMAGIFVVALMLIAAITVDASRIFAAKNELQTASDAAALAGALQLLEGPGTFVDTARAYAVRNLVEQQPVDSVEVVWGIWVPADRTFIEGGEPKDAVRVTTRQQLPLSIARVFRDSTITVSATAIAWSSGPVMEPSCLKPIAVPYSRLLQILGYPAWSDVQLNDDDIRALREMPERDREWHFHYGNQENEGDDGGTNRWGEEHFRRDQYFPIDIDSTWDRGDPSSFARSSIDPEEYRSYLQGPPDGRCSQRVRTNDLVRSEPGPKMDAMRDGLSDVCRALGGTPDVSTSLTCVSGGEQIVMPLRVVFWSGYNPSPEVPPWYDSGQGARLITRMTGSFVVDSVNYDAGDRIRNGRMWGHFDVQRDFGVVDETIASTLLRPVLVW
jgi:hypothetical protein